MEYRFLGRTGLKVSVVGYGGGRVRPDAEADEVLAILRAAREAGVNFFDTAPSYGDGRSEELLGQALETDREECVLTTKTETFAAADIPGSLEASLRRLRTDCVDLLQFHGGWFPEADVEVILAEGLPAYQRLREQGKTRFLGFSADGPSPGVWRLLETGAFDAIQVNFSLMYGSTHDQFADRGLIPDAKARGMGVFTMRSTTSSVFPRWLASLDPALPDSLDWEAALLTYTLSNPAVDSALMSLRSLEDVSRCAAVGEASDGRLNLRRLHGRE